MSPSQIQIVSFIDRLLILQAGIDTMTGILEEAAPGAVIEIRKNGTPIGTTTADENGRWHYNAVGLIDGVFSFTAHTSTASSSAWQLTINQPAVLIAPYVQHANVADPVNDRQTLAYYQINADIDVVVPDYGMQPGETVKLYWVSRNTTYGSEIQTVANPPQPLRFKISKYEVIDAIGYRSTRIHYTVKRGTAEPVLSRILSLDVTGYPGEAPLVAPTLLEARDNISVQKQTGMGTSTTVEVRGLGITEWQSDTQTLGSEEYLNFPISAAWLKANEGNPVRFNYSVRLKPSDGSNYRFSQLLRLDRL